MSIQWFPGHMAVAREKAAETMELVDLVIEVVDARLPEASCNPMIKKLRVHRQRPCLKVLNKADLADPAATQAWLDFYNEQKGVKAVALSCKKPADVASVPALCQSIAPHRNERTKPLRMMIMGIPNVGKSTLMNALLKRRVAQVGDEPAVTKVQQTLDLNAQMTITDTPGLMWPKIRYDSDGYMLAASHAIGTNEVDEEDVAAFLGDLLLARYPGLLTARYGFATERARAHGRDRPDRSHRPTPRMPAERWRARYGKGLHCLVARLSNRQARTHQPRNTADSTRDGVERKRGTSTTDIPSSACGGGLGWGRMARVGEVE